MLHDNATARHLALLRMWVFGMWLGDLLKDPYSDVAQIPLEYYVPVGILKLVPTGFWEVALSEPALPLWWGTLAVLLALCVGGVPFYRGVALFSCVMLTFYQGVIFGFTTVVHGPVAPLYMAWILAVFPSADALAIRSAPDPPASNFVYRAALLLATVLFLTTYMMTGVRRILHGGIDIFLDGSMLRFLARNSSSPAHVQEGLGLRVLESPALSTFFEVGFAVVTLFEILSLLCISSKWFRRAWLAVMIPFHVLSWPLLQVLFLHNILLLLVLVIDLDGIAERIGVGRWLRSRPMSKPA